MAADPEVELYVFTTDATTYRYTSSSEDVSTGGYTYTAAALSRQGPRAGDDANRSEVTIVATCDLPYVLACINAGYFGTAAIYAWNGDADSWTLLWDGPVVAVTLAGAEAQIVVQSVIGETRRDGLWAKWQVTCRHALYGTGCGLVADDHKIPGTVTVVSGAEVTATGLDGVLDAWLIGGMLKGPTGEYRMITAHTGTTVTLMSAMALEVGDAVEAYYGCDHLLATCQSVRFMNEDNFGGFPWLPTENAGEWAGSFSA